MRAELWGPGLRAPVGQRLTPLGGKDAPRSPGALPPRALCSEGRAAGVLSTAGCWSGVLAAGPLPAGVSAAGPAQSTASPGEQNPGPAVG